MKDKEFNSLDDWQVGWWKKGNQYRYCYGVMWLMLVPMVRYQTKSKRLKNSSHMTGVNPVTDRWFPNAEYLGLELPEEEKKTDSPAS